MALREEILSSFKKSLEGMADRGRIRLAEQGHKATGKLIRSLEAQITSDDINQLVGVILAEDYGRIVDSGVPANRIPYSPGSGAKNSRYIQALIDWIDIIRPGLPDNERKSFAFAIAKTHKKEGMPTKGSRRFSKDGTRTNWIETAFEGQADEIERELRLIRIINASFERSIDQATR